MTTPTLTLAATVLMLASTAGAATPCRTQLPTYWAAHEALKAEGLRPATDAALEASALKAMRQRALAGGNDPAEAALLAGAKTPCELVTLLKPEAMALEKLDHAAAEGLLAASGDPAARLIASWWRRGNTPSVAGIGVMFKMEPDALLIEEVFEGGAASLAGLATGDRIVAVDGKPLAGLTADAASDLIKGVVGTNVRLALVRAGAGPGDMVLKRRPIGAVAPEPRPDMLPAGDIEADYGAVDDQVGYIKLASLDGADYRPGLAEALMDCEGAKGLVIDLRGCAGGDARQVPDLVSMVAGSGPLFTLIDRHQGAHAFTAASTDPALARVPLAVLIDRTTSAAGELLAYGLRVSRQTALVGEPTAGHGQVQTFKPLTNGMRLAFTSHEAVLSNGQRLGQGGLRPDIQAAPRPAVPAHPSAGALEAIVPADARTGAQADLALEGAIEYLRSKHQKPRAPR
jgi:carboxyl-terminal processing protease